MSTLLTQPGSLRHPAAEDGPGLPDVSCCPPARTPGTGTRPRPGSCSPGRSAARSGRSGCAPRGPGGGSRPPGRRPGADRRGRRSVPSPTAGSRHGGQASRRSTTTDSMTTSSTGRSIAPVGTVGDLVDDRAAGAVGDLAEDRVPPVEVRRRADGDEELRAVGARAGVGHGQQVRPVELQLGVELVAELVARAAGAGAQRVAALDHEAADDPVEDRAVVELGRCSSRRSRGRSTPWRPRRAR